MKNHKQRKLSYRLKPEKKKKGMSDGLVTKLLLHTTWFQRRNKQQYVISSRADWVNIIEQMEKQNLVDNCNIKISITQQIRVGNSKRWENTT